MAQSSKHNNNTDRQFCRHRKKTESTHCVKKVVQKQRERRQQKVKYFQPVAWHSDACLPVCLTERTNVSYAVSVVALYASQHLHWKQISRPISIKSICPYSTHTTRCHMMMITMIITMMMIVERSHGTGLYRYDHHRTVPMEGSDTDNDTDTDTCTGCNILGTILFLPLVADRRISKDPEPDTCCWGSAAWESD